MKRTAKTPLKKIAPIPKPGSSWKKFPQHSRPSISPRGISPQSESPESSWKIHPEIFVESQNCLVKRDDYKNCTGLHCCIRKPWAKLPTKNHSKNVLHGEKLKESFYDWGCEIQQKNTCLFSSCSLPCLSFCGRFKGNLKKKTPAVCSTFKLSNSWGPLLTYREERP